MAQEQALSRRQWLRVSALTTAGVGLAGMSGGIASAAGATALAAAGEDPCDYSDPYARWPNGPNPQRSAGYFPIGVWLQSPRNAPRYLEAGINCYVGLWQGPTEEQLAELARHGMRVICDQNEVGLGHRNDLIIMGWLQQDEPDNAQRRPDGSYGPPVDPVVVIQRYREMTAADPSRPVLLNLGQGVANDEWVGRGPDASLDDYYGYCRGTDIASFDVYPVAGGAGLLPLWYVAKGVDRLHMWCDDGKVVWNFVETTNISSGRQPTPQQVRAEVWMSLINGSRGILYFVHRFAPRFEEAGLLNDPGMLAAVTAINRQIRELAPILNRPTLACAVEVESSNLGVPIDTMVKRMAGVTYLFAACMRDSGTTGTFHLRHPSAHGSAVTVIGEDRTMEVVDGRFSDAFEPYGVHLYRIGPDRATAGA